MAYCTDFIDLCGEPQPDDETIHLDSIEMREIYLEYRRDHVVQRLTDSRNTDLQWKPLSENEFTLLWNKAFPKVYIRGNKGIVQPYPIIRPYHPNPLP